MPRTLPKNRTTPRGLKRHQNIPPPPPPPPPPPSPPLPLILHSLGDSETHGFGNTRSYRPFLINALIARNWDVTTVGTLSGSTWGEPELNHDGHDGWSSGHFWQNWALPADIAIIWLGANDIVTLDYSAAQFATNMTGIRNRHEAVCNKVVLVTQFPGSNWTLAQQTRLAEYKDVADTLVTSKTTACHRLYNSFNPATMLRANDTIHLNDSVGNPWAANEILQHLIDNCGV